MRPTTGTPTRLRAGRTPAECLLAAGVPLTLLLDLAAPDGPDSRAIFMTELGPELPRQEAAPAVRRTSAG